MACRLFDKAGIFKLPRVGAHEQTFAYRVVENCLKFVQAIVAKSMGWNLIAYNCWERIATKSVGVHVANGTGQKDDIVCNEIFSHSSDLLAPSVFW